MRRNTPACYRGRLEQPLARLVNDKVTSSLVYSFVFAAWFFVGLKYAFTMQTHQCVWWATGMGALVAAAALLFLGLLTREPRKANLDEAGEPVTAVIVG